MAHLLFTPSDSTIIYLLLSFCSYVVLRIIYNLTLHPLARFPGPKAAAITSLYGAYYDLLLGGYVKKFPSLHDKHGPIIRIFPSELHVRDIDSYEQIFKPGTKFPKAFADYNNPLVAGSHFTILETRAAMVRKNMLMPYFSKASIARLCPSLEEKIRTLIGQLENFALKGKEGKGGDVDMSRAYACLTCDAIMDYCYGRAGGALQAPGFEYAFTEGLEVMSANGRWDKYVRRLGVVVLRLMLVMPVQVVEMVSAPMGLVRVWVDTCRRTILEQKKKRKGNGEGEGERRESTVFDNLLNPNAEKGQSIPSDHDLTAEAVTVLSAGLGTTATALTLTTWYILTTPGVLTKLVRELRDAVPDKDVMPSLAALEKLPYLHATIKEGLRFATGVPGRLPRVVPESGTRICGQDIPAGSIVSHSSCAYHSLAQVFKDAAKFIPERWLDPTKEMERYFVPFSKGSRSCLGTNLAYAEMYLTIAALFRRFEFTIYKTTELDMDWVDNVILTTRGHLRVLVKELEN